MVLMVCVFSVDSASEASENDTDDSDSRDLTGYACRHCFTTSMYIQWLESMVKSLICSVVNKSRPSSMGRLLRTDGPAIAMRRLRASRAASLTLKLVNRTHSCKVIAS